MNYPNKKIATKKFINYGKRGMNLENDINESNIYYRSIDKALIYKKPTPIRIVKTSFNEIKGITINEAYYEVPSTTDYNGIYKGKYIDFEAKETKNKTSFSLRNIHSHQINHLCSVIDHGGIAFVIIRFTELNKTFFLDAKYLKDFINNNERKSIPLNYIEEYGHLIEEKYNPRIDYLKIIDKNYLGE